MNKYSWEERKRMKAYKEKVGHCEKCGAVENLNVHHIIPISVREPRPDDPLAVLCNSCHQKCHHKDEMLVARLEEEYKSFFARFVREGNTKFRMFFEGENE